MSTVRGLRSAAPSASSKQAHVERDAGLRPSAPPVIAGDRIQRNTREPARQAPYLSLSADLGFIVGVSASLTIAGGKLYGSVGEFTGLVPGVGVSLEAGVVRPNRGETVASTLEGTSFTASAGYGIGAQTSVSNAGTTVGGGLTLPSVGVGVTETRRLLPW